MKVKTFLLTAGIAISALFVRAEQQSVAYFAGPAESWGNAGQWIRTGVRLVGEARRYFTLEIWVYPLRTVSSHLIEQYGYSNGRQNFNIAKQSGSQNMMQLKASLIGYTGSSMTSKKSFAINKWTHVAWVVDNDVWRLYIDGELDSTTSGHGSHLLDAASADGFMIGNNSTTLHSGYCCAYLAEARVWSVARTQEQIKENMNVRIEQPWSVEGLFGYWPLVDGEASYTSHNRYVKNYANMDASLYACDWLDDYGYMYAEGTNVLWQTSDLPVTGSLPDEDNALSFKGSKNRTGAVDTQIQIAPANFTFMGWCLLSQRETGTKSILLSKGDSGNGSLCLAEEDGYLSLAMRGGSDGATNEVATVDVYDKWPRYAWRHLAVTKSGDTVRFYLNGEKIGESAGFTLSMQETPFLIGGSSNGGYNGLMKSVGLWSRVLSQDDILKLMNARPRNESTMLGFWPMNEGSGNVLENLRQGGVSGKPAQGDFTWCRGATMPALGDALMKLGILLMYH